MPDETNKKLDYLKREEVRTMEKDLAKLREKEAQIERERIAGLKTEDYLKMEKERQEQARKEAEERQKVEEETKEKLAQSEALRRARQDAELLAGKAKEESEELKKERLRAQLEQIQEKEEEVRKRFLEKISAKAEGRPIAPEPEEIPSQPIVPETPIPTPPITPPSPAEVPVTPGTKEGPKPSFKFRIPTLKIPIPKIPAIPTPKITGYFPKGPSLFEKLWVRIIISLLVFAILAAVATFWYWYLIAREIPAAPQPPLPPPTVQIPETNQPMINEKILGFGYHLPQIPRVIDTIVIHSVYNVLSKDPHSLEGVIEEYGLYKVAAHYLIDRDGKIYQTAPKEAIAYHAGVSQMPDGRTDVNRFSIGIELIYTKDESPAESQYLSLNQLIKHLRGEYNIPADNILGHKDIAPTRKNDPWNFDWGKLVEK